MSGASDLERVDQRLQEDPRIALLANDAWTTLSGAGLSTVSAMMIPHPGEVVDAALAETDREELVTISRCGSNLVARSCNCCRSCHAIMPWFDIAGLKATSARRTPVISTATSTRRGAFP
jgi:hypothetical protein